MPLTPMVPELAGEIERARVDTGLSGEEMLAFLRDRGEWYVEIWPSASMNKPIVFLDTDVIFADCLSDTAWCQSCRAAIGRNHIEPLRGRDGSGNPAPARRQALVPVVGHHSR